MSSMLSIPHEELPILEALINIRNRLTALKKDSSEFIRSHDVQQIYQQVIKQITRLNTVRDELQANSQAASATSSTSDHHETSDRSEGHDGDDSPIFQTNRVDTTLNDVFSLLSLFFLTIGRSKESPATFSQLSCMKQLLDHLQESGVYTEADLQPFGARLAELREIIRKDGDGGRHPPQLNKLMTRKFEACEKTLRKLEGTLKVLSVELVPIHQRIITIRRQLAAAASKPKPARAEIKQLQEELRKIDAKRVDGKFLGPGGSSVPAGQAILVGLLEECFEICHDITVRNDEVPMTLQPIYDRLVEIKSQLEHLVLTHRWTLRETDLWNYQVTLKEIDRLRVDGKFVDAEGKQPEGQLVLLYLLRRCYGLIYRLVASSEPISEELMPISNKLSTVSKCLKEVSKYGGPFTMRDLYPYRLALHQIDNMRSKVIDKDGTDTGLRKWLGRDGSVPEGQAILRAQYEEVEQTIEEMLNREDDDDDEDDGDIWEGSTVSSAEDTDTESAASISDDDEHHTGMDGPSADMVRQALMARGPMLGMLHPDAPPSQASSAAQSRQPSSTNITTRPPIEEFTGPIPHRGSIASSSGATIRTFDGNLSSVASELPSTTEVPSAATHSNGTSNTSPLIGTEIEPTVPAQSCVGADQAAAQMRHLKIGRDFRDGVGDLTGLSSRSPPVTCATSPVAPIGSLSAALAQSGSPLPPSLESVMAKSETATEGVDHLPVGAAQLAVPSQTILEGQLGTGPPTADGTHVGALMQGVQAISIPDTVQTQHQFTS